MKDCNVCFASVEDNAEVCPFCKASLKDSKPTVVSKPKKIVFEKTESNASYCPSCMCEVPKNEKYCPQCGMAVRKDNFEKSLSDFCNTMQKNTKRYEEKPILSTGSFWLGFLAGLIGLLIAALVIKEEGAAKNAGIGMLTSFGVTVILALIILL